MSVEWMVFPLRLGSGGRSVGSSESIRRPGEGEKSETGDNIEEVSKREDGAEPHSRAVNKERREWRRNEVGRAVARSVTKERNIVECDTAAAAAAAAAALCFY